MRGEREKKKGGRDRGGGREEMERESARDRGATREKDIW